MSGAKTAGSLFRPTSPATVAQDAAPESGFPPLSDQSEQRIALAFFLGQYSILLALLHPVPA
jgi:hypothetical protein